MIASAGRDGLAMLHLYQKRENSWKTIASKFILSIVNVDFASKVYKTNSLRNNLHPLHPDNIDSHQASARRMAALRDDVSHLPEEILSICFMTDDFRLCTASQDNIIRIWDTSSGELLHSMAGHTEYVSLTEPHPVHYDILLTGGHDGTIFLWDVKKGTKIFMCETQNMITAISFSPNGSMFAVSNNRGIVHLFGIGYNISMYSQAPVEQFLAIEQRRVFEDIGGNLFEVESQQPAQDVDAGPLTSLYNVAYVNGCGRPEKFEYIYDEEVIKEDFKYRTQLLEREKRSPYYTYQRYVAPLFLT